MVQPDTIDEDARGERIVGDGNRPCEFQPTAADSKRLPFTARQRGEKLPRHDFTEVARVASNEDARVTWMQRVLQGHRVRSRLGRADPIGHQPLLRVKLLLRRGIDEQELFDIINRDRQR